MNSRLRRLATLSTGVLSIGLGACTPRDVGSTPVSAQSLVQLDVTYGRTIDAENVQLDAEAHFVRYRAVATEGAVHGASAGVAALLGITRADELATGTCRSDASAEAGATSLEVALLDAGSLTIRNDGVTETVLEPHHYPEIVPYVTGVVYGQSGAPAIVPAARQTLEIEAQGGEDVGPFVASAILAHGFPALSLTGAGRSTSLHWSSDAAASTVLVELHWAGAHAGALRCRAADSGSLVLASILPADALTALDAALASGATAEVSVARTSQAPLDAPGAGAGNFFVTLRDSALVRSR